MHFRSFLRPVFLAGVCLSLLAGGNAFAQPSNDLCDDAEFLALGSVITGTTNGATFDGVGFCGTSNTAPGVWYKVLGDGGVVTASTNHPGTAYDTKLSVFSGEDCGTLTCVGGNDDLPGTFNSEVAWMSVAGETYRILVHGFGSATGTFELSVSSSGPPVGNETCTSAEPLSCDDLVAGSTVGASRDQVPFCGTSDGTGGGLWYELVGDGSGVTLTTCNPGTDYDTKIRVYTGTCNFLDCVTGNDDDISCPFSALNSKVQFGTVPGEIYYVLVHGFGGREGRFQLSAGCSGPPPNDDACDAEPVSVGDQVAFDISFATVEPDEPSPGPGTGPASCNSQDGWCSFETDVDNSVWYDIMAPASGCLDVETAGTGDTQLAAWSAFDCSDFSGFQELGANDDGGPGLLSRMELRCLDPGEELLVQLDGFNGSNAAGTVSFDDCGLEPLALDAGDCQTRFINSPLAGGANHLIASPTGGFPPYAYSWEPADSITTNPNRNHISVEPSAPTTYTVTVTDGNGCTATDTVFVNVIDLSGGCAQLCHRPPDAPDNEENVCLVPSAAQNHIERHGDRLGPCENECIATNPPPPEVDLSLSLTTDQFGAETAFTLTNLNSGELIFGADPGTLPSSTTLDYGPVAADPNACYDFTITDTFGDGICCNHGEGSYTIDFGGIPIPSPSGGAFGSFERVTFGNCP